jgi:hypothetical protein
MGDPDIGITADQFLDEMAADEGRSSGNQNGIALVTHQHILATSSSAFSPLTAHL